MGSHDESGFRSIQFFFGAPISSPDIPFDSAHSHSYLQIGSDTSSASFFGDLLYEFRLRAE